MTKRAAQNMPRNKRRGKVRVLPRKLFASGASLALLAASLTATVITAPSAIAAPGDNPEVFSSDGTYTVPAGVTAVKIVAIGGGGGAGATDSSNGGVPAGNGGAGAKVTTYQEVTEHQELDITIGLKGSGGQPDSSSITSGGTGYGSGGNGGSSGNNTNAGGGAGGGSTAVTGNDVEIIAGGGGGGGGRKNANAQTFLDGGSGGTGATAGDSGYNAGGNQISSGAKGGSSVAAGIGGLNTDSGNSTLKGGDDANANGGTGIEPSSINFSGSGGGGAGYGGGAAGVSISDLGRGGAAGGSKQSENALPGTSYEAATSGAGTGGTASTSASTPGDDGADGEVTITALNAATSISAIPGNSKATISWTEPSQPAGVGTVTYQVYKDGVAVPGATSSPAIIDDLQGGEEYSFTVVATTEDGLATTSSEESVTPEAPDVPGAPTNVAAAPRSGGAALNWTAPDNDGGAPVTGYEVTVSTNSGLYDSVPGSGTCDDAASTGTTSCAVDGLLDGNFYSFKVAAINSQGTGPESAAPNEITPGPAFVSKWTTTTPNEVIALPFINPNQSGNPLGASYNATVYWGDGTSNTFDSSNINDLGRGRHTYATAGTYTVTVTGQMTGLSCRASEKLSNLDCNKMGDISAWGPVKFQENANSAFEDITNLSITATDAPDLSSTKFMNKFFMNTNFNNPINHWDVSNVTTMDAIFMGATQFNQDLNIWDVSKVTNKNSMFRGATTFNGDITNWTSHPVGTTMASMFQGASAFNRDITGWNTENVTSMSAMFHTASSFNQNISAWNTANVTTMADMFSQATVFNQPIGSWNTGNVTNMSYMFELTPNFNQPLSTWDTSKVTNMSYMFRGASAFNQPLVTTSGGWNTSSVTNMNSMFQDSSAFNQSLGTWNVTAVEGTPDWDEGSPYGMVNMLSESAMSTANYNSTLTGWGSQNVQNEITLGATDIKYSPGAPATARTTLTNAPKNWTINDDGETDTPGAVTNINGTPGNAAIGLSWTAAPLKSGTGPITGYRIEKAAGPGFDSWSDVIADTGDDNVTFNVTGLDNGTAYKFRITAQNGDGWSAVSTTSDPFTPAIQAPGAPTDVIAQPLNGAGKLTWAAPASDGGEAITGYKIEQNVGNTTWLPVTNDTGNTDTNYDLTGLTNGLSYEFRVSAINSVGTGVESTPSTAIIPSASTFVSTWKTDNTTTGSSNSDQVRLPLRPDGTYNMTIYWGDGTSTAYQCSSGCTAQMHTYSVAGTYTISIQGTFKGFRFNNAGDRNKILDISNWGPFTFHGDGAFFYGANNLTASATDTPDLSQITSLGNAFNSASSFNSDISNWNTSTINYMSGMFMGATSFNNGGHPLATTSGGWDTSNVTSMTSMFQSSAFNQDIASWNTSNVSAMSNLFYGNTAFNNGGQPLVTTSGGWNTSSATNMSGMFRDVGSFNQNVASWNTGNVANMSSMFRGATSFNNNGQSLVTTSGGWNTSKVTNMSDMFAGASTFNQDVSTWDTSKVTNMASLFNGASSFNQNIGSWNINAVTGLLNMLQDTALSTPNYNSILTGWGRVDTTVKNNLALGGVGPTANRTQYSPGAPTTARTTLTTAPKNWTIVDGGETDTPGVVTNINGTPANTAVDLSWTAAALKSGTGPINGYRIEKAAGPGFDSWSEVIPSTGNDNVTFNVTGLDNDTAYKFRITAKNDDGWSPVSAISDAFTPNPTAPLNTTPPAVTGTTVTGETLTTDDGTWTGDPAPGFTYQWQACNNANCDDQVTDIGGATADSFELTNDQIGSWVRAKVTGTNVAGSTDAYSNAVGPISDDHANQTISFPLASSVSIQSTTMSLHAVASSGLPVTYSTTTSAICTVSNSTVTLKKEGTCTIKAEQDGDSAWYPATPVTKSIFVSDVPTPLLAKCPNGTCAGANLAGMNLEGLNLSGLNFVGANLTGTKLKRANLTGAILKSANLRNTNLTDARLSRANLTRANLSGATLTRANLSKANLKGANLKKAKAKGSKKSRNRGEVSRYVPPNYSVNLSGANLAGVNLSGAQLAYANLTSANLQSATLVKANLRASNLARANAKKANFTKADLRGANLVHTNLKGAKLKGAKLRGSYR